MYLCINFIENQNGDGFSSIKVNKRREREREKDGGIIIADITHTVLDFDHRKESAD